MNASSKAIDRVVVLFLTSMGWASAWGDEIDTRNPVPDVVELKAAERLVRDVFAGEYAAARNDEAKSALAKRILTVAAESAENRAAQYVLFRVARDVAAAGRDAETALKAVEELGRRFRVDTLPMKIEVLKGTAGKARLPANHRALLPQFSKVVEEAIASERFEMARQACRLATASANKARDSAARKKIAAQLKTLTQLEEAFADVKRALAVLDERPADPNANLVVGKYRCFRQGDWERGLPMLALASDRQLKALALRELAEPAAAEEQSELADGWWELAEHMKQDEQQQARLRAGHWYRRALNGLAGLGRLRAMRRIEQVSDEPEQVASASSGARGQPSARSPKPVNVMQMIDPQKDTIKGMWRFQRGVLVSAGGTLDRIHIPYVPPDEYTLEIVATRVSGSKGLTIGLVARGKSFSVSVDCMGRRSGLDCVDGKSTFSGNASVRSGQLLTTGKPSTINCHVHDKGVRVTVDGRVIIDWQEGFDRISTDKGWTPKDRRLPLVGTSTPYHIHSIMLTPISGPGQPARVSEALLRKTGSRASRKYVPKPELGNG